MRKIMTITLNPALDKSIVIHGLVPEKKLRCSDAVLEPGGGGINVTRAIHKLGGHSRAMYLAGGYTGEKLTELVKAENIQYKVFPIKEDTRENFIAVDANTNLQYRFGMEGPKVSEEEWLAILDAVQKIEDLEFIGNRIIAGWQATESKFSDDIISLSEISSSPNKISNYKILFYK